VTVDTAVEHTKSVSKRDEEPKYDACTSHPVSLAVRKTVVEPMLDTKHDKGGNVNQIYEA